MANEPTKNRMIPKEALVKTKKYIKNPFTPSGFSVESIKKSILEAAKEAKALADSTDFTSHRMARWDEKKKAWKICIGYGERNISLSDDELYTREISDVRSFLAESIKEIESGEYDSVIKILYDKYKEKGEQVKTRKRQ